MILTKNIQKLLVDKEGPNVARHIGTSLRTLVFWQRFFFPEKRFVFSFSALVVVR